MRFRMVVFVTCNGLTKLDNFRPVHNIVGMVMKTLSNCWFNLHSLEGILRFNVSLPQVKGDGAALGIGLQALCKLHFTKRETIQFMPPYFLYNPKHATCIVTIMRIMCLYH